MNKSLFTKRFKEELDSMYKIVLMKNSDYSWWEKTEDPFQNFKLVESLGITSVENGILVRICDKMSRIASLISQEAKVSDEKITDTCIDAANYFIILRLYLESKWR